MATAEAEAAAVGCIVERFADADFVRQLMAAANRFRDPAFEPALADFLRTRRDLITRWATYSADQRWTPAAYVEGTTTGWYDGDCREENHHPDEAAAVADFIRRTAHYLDANRVDVPKG